MTEIDTKRLREIAEKPRQVRWAAAYSRHADDDESATVVEAEKQHMRVCFPTSDGDPAVMEHIAAFDPPTCRSLLDALEQARAENASADKAIHELFGRVMFEEHALAEAEARVGELETAVERQNHCTYDALVERDALRARLEAAEEALRNSPITAHNKLAAFLLDAKMRGEG